ncbi:PSD1 and planctomycete cytochrome C domain-containing protein [soil metagenome]
MTFTVPTPYKLAGSFSAAVWLFVLAPYAKAEQTFPADQIEFFEKKVRPILAESCQECHGAHKQKNGLRLDSREAALRGSDYKKVIVPGDPENSLLIKAVRHVSGVEAMPDKKPALATNDIEVLVQWIKMGAPWPQEAVTASHTPKWEEHWAFQPVKKPGVPAAEKAGTKNPVDAFVSAKLSAAGLDFAPAADRATLARRLYLDVTGLLPTYEELQAFVNDKSPEATNQLVDRLLSSTHYGERWARHWLDVARYADTDGYEAGGKDLRYPHAYTYRDWVVKALNDDMPYSHFITCQLAADRLKDAPKNDLAALGFLTVNDRFLGDRLLQADDRIDTISRGFLGLTVACARCHDHKYDPIPSKDYYALYSIINSSEMPEEFPIIGQPDDKNAIKVYQEKVAEVEKQKEAFRLEVLDDVVKAERLRDYLLFVQANKDASGSDFAGNAGKNKIRDRLAKRWKDFLVRYALTDKPHPVMLAWKEFSALPANEFAAKSAEVLQKLHDPATCNSVVATAFNSKPAPKSLADVAMTYAEVFLQHRAVQPFPDATKEAIRKLLQTEPSPMMVTTEDVRSFFTRKDTEHMTKFDNEILKIEIDEAGAPLRAMVMVDKGKPEDGHVMIRGNPARQGEPAPRAFLTFLGGKKFTDGSGRLELAQAIASPDNPLTARVMVNRVWLDHFGKPLVSQTSDFGVQSPKPEQAELLDWLAATFMEQGWSMKKLHRVILTSRTYQQATMSTPQKDLKDPENNLLSRMNRQRLDYEELRDSLLQATATLDANKVGGRSVLLDAAEANTRRSIYLFVDRYEQASVPAMFDFANPDRHSPQRFVTTVPQQALFLMNSPFMRDQSGNLASKLPVEGSAPDSKTVQALYRKVLLRDPKPKELEVAQRFLSASESTKEEPAYLWQYGAGTPKLDAEGKVAGFDFQPFSTFAGEKKNGRWAMSNTLPDPKWSFLHWNQNGGHPDTKIAAVLRWVSTIDGWIRVSGGIKRASDQGNGVHGWVISSAQGILKDKLVAPKTTGDMSFTKLQVKKGEILDFIVGSENDINSDSFDWKVNISRLNPETGATEYLTQSDRDFMGPEHWPMSRTKPQSPLAQLVQVLMMSNEFQFVD